MKIICFALATAAIAIFVFLFQHNASIIIAWINRLGFLAPVFFLLVYCVATIFFLPTMMLTLAGGAIFGPVFGTLINLLGASLGAACAFCISRYWVSDWLAAKKIDRINKLITGVERRGWQFVAMVRIVPIIPFNLVNYGFGLTRIKFSHYLITTLIFLTPTEIISTWCGYAGMDMLIHSEELYKHANLFFVLGVSLLLIGLKLFKHKQRQNLLETI